MSGRRETCACAVKLFLLTAIALGIPSARALDENALRSAAQYSAAQQGTVFVAYQSGRKIFSDTPNGGSLSRGYKIYSGTKMFWILAALAAQQDGLLSLDERASETIREWADDSQKSRITVRQLLNFTSGLEPNFALHSESASNRDALAIRTRLAAAPGTAFMYGPSALQVFHQILERKLAAKGENPTRFLEKRVLRPLGLGPQRYVPDRSGNPLLAAGFIMNASQWRKMGQCLLDRGSPIVASGALGAAASGTGVNPAFSMALWNNHLASGGQEIDPEDMLERPWARQSWRGACLCQSAPSDLVANIGSGGQRLYVVPSQDLIILRQGSGGHFRDAEFLRRLFAR